ncbi:MAG: hypothetical protein AB7U97_15195, partial [Pirellulales bacterium]
IASNKQLLEFYLEGSSNFASKAIGLGYNTAIGARDLSFTYSDFDGSSLSGIVQYVGGRGSDALAVPEPAVGAILLTALAAVCFCRR